MGHRHTFSTSQMFETNHDQHWNYIHPEVPFVHLASSNIVENNSLHPQDNLQIVRARHVSHWNPSARVNEIPSSRCIVHAPHNQFDVSSTRDSFRSSVPVDTFHVPGNHVHHIPLSNYIADNNAFDVTVGNNVRGPYKRKSPMIPCINEIGSTSGYYCAGSTSNASRGQNVDVQHSRLEPISMPPGYNPPIGGENYLRNVRSRSSFELGPEVAGPQRVTNYPQHPSSSRHLTDHCNRGDRSSQGPTLPLSEMNHVHISTASHGRTILADSGNLNQGANHFIVGTNTSNSSGQIGGYSHHPSSSRNPASLQRFHPFSAQTRGAHSSYPQRSNPTNRVGIGSFQLGQAASLEEGLRFVGAESYSNRHPRAFTSASWRNSDRSRSRSLANRYRSFSVDAVSHDHMTPEGGLVIGHSSHSSRSLFDQHGELSLDVDNMSYEELLALGERIGTVSTGLSDDQQLKCLKETVNLSSEQGLMEQRCVICLEEYQNMDQIGSLKSCGHEYHMGCIKKWLSVKNLCPICKAPALPDDEKQKMKASI